LRSDGRNRTLAYPKEAIEPLSIDSQKLLETFEFREPYGSSGVQRFGEKASLSEKIGQLDRSEGWRAYQKSLFLLGSIASQSTRRILGCVRLAERERFELSVRLSLPKRASITIESLHHIAANPAGFTLRLSFCRFHDASTNDISFFNSYIKNPRKRFFSRA
jgi:hypothetical protein